MLSIPTIEVTYVPDDDIDCHIICTCADNENHSSSMHDPSDMIRNEESVTVDEIDGVISEPVRAIAAMIPNVLAADKKTTTFTDEKLKLPNTDVDGENWNASVDDDSLFCSLRRSKRRKTIPLYLSREFEHDRMRTNISAIETKNDLPLNDNISDTKEILDNVPNFTQDVVMNLETYYGKHFPEWLEIMRQGRNVVVYGVGSKRILLETFRRRHLQNEFNMVIEGYIKNISLTSVLSTIANLMFNIPVATRIKNYSHLLSLFIDHKPAITDLFVIVHNIDGPSLRSVVIQEIFIKLSRIPAVHLLVSAEQINIHSMCSDYTARICKWVWYKASTWRNYIIETASKSIKLTDRVNFNFIQQVMDDLSNLTIHIFTVLIYHWKILVDDRRIYKGIDISTLFDLIRCKNLMVRSKQNLRQHLIELKDCKLLSIDRHRDTVKLAIDNQTLYQLWNYLQHNHYSFSDHDDYM
ncbi:hypothetical protein GJ496_009203 [Pomphorhynchus laevis]|nr:hypothetical protein GJ496_009203 [Pomphorhynchus laevis]